MLPLAGDRRRALCFNKRQWAESIALEGEAYLQGGQIRDAFVNFKRLRLNQMKIPSPLLSADANNLLSDGASIVTRWREYFNTLLNRPLVDPPPSLIQAASEATVDPSISIDPPSLSETYKAVLKINAGKASGICGIYPEYIHYAGNKAMHYLTDLFCTMWETETVPEE